MRKYKSNLQMRLKQKATNSTKQLAYQILWREPAPKNKRRVKV